MNDPVYRITHIGSDTGRERLTKHTAKYDHNVALRQHLDTHRRELRFQPQIEPIGKNRCGGNPKNNQRKAEKPLPYPPPTSE